MRLVSVVVGPYKSINVRQDVAIDPEVTVLVGMNEAGKTVFLEALHKSRDALGIAKYNHVEDYPRKDLHKYEKEHDTQPTQVVKLTFELNADDAAAVSARTGAEVAAGLTFSLTHTYDNEFKISLSVDESKPIAALAAGSEWGTDARNAITKCSWLREVPAALKAVSLSEAEKAAAAVLDKRLEAPIKLNWYSAVSFEAWQVIRSLVPKFAFFSDLETLPSKANLKDLQTRAAGTDPNRKLRGQDRAVLALLRMANISAEDLSGASGYEPLRARLEAVSISLTDQIMAFWKVNEGSLEVMVDIKEDSAEEPPFNSGPNLYLRIRNLRHRGVSTPFHQRSRGFVWFFSFLVWFDQVEEQLRLEGKENTAAPILLLDEPALSLHALAQRDFLAYIDDLTKRNQVIFTTHSPFMVHSDRLDQVRVVEDRDPDGTTITQNVGSSNDRTKFPLQAALGYTIAQNLFISERNLVVEGPSELLYLTAVSTILEAGGHAGLRPDVTIVPAGGLDKVVTFVALLNASGLKLSVLHDYNGKPDQKLMDLVRQKLISGKAIFNPSQFRDLKKLGQDTLASDIEDLLPVDMYLEYFNQAFAKQLGTATVKEEELPARPRIIQRLEAWLEASKIELRPSGDFNHYTVAAAFAAKPPKKLPAESRDRFGALFKAINALY